MKFLVSVLFPFSMIISASSAQSTIPPAPPDNNPCFSNLDDISWSEFFVQDVEIPREYVLCPNTNFTVGVMDSNTGEFVGGSFAMTCRKNTIIKCGVDGKRDNNCTVRDGTLGFLALAGTFDNPGEFLDGVEIQGVTFENLRDVGMSAESWGHVTMVDCAFVNNRNIAPVLLQYNGDISGSSRRRELTASNEESNLDVSEHHYHMVIPPSWRRKMAKYTQQSPPHLRRAVESRDRELEDSPPQMLKVDFIGCDFVGNQFATPQLPGVVSVLYESQDVTFDRCNFIGNNYTDPSAPLSYMILNNHNAHVKIQNSCFIDNDTFGRGPVTVLADSAPEVNHNYGTVDDNVSCEFVGWSSSAKDPPQCVDYDASECLAKVETASPTLVVPTAPSTEPTLAPVASTNAPVAQTGMPSTVSPVVVPTKAPTAAPTSDRSPPTQPPVPSPTEPPTPTSDAWSSLIGSAVLVRLAVVAVAFA